MSRLIDTGLEQLSRLIFKMGDLTEKTVSLSLDCYMKGVNAHEKGRVWSETLVSLSEEAEDKAIVSTLLFIRHLERIADHAAGIRESVIYIVTGERVSLR